jgi:hypothetical protein
VPADRGHLRVSDSDREAAAEVLRQAAGDGRITFTELDERLGLAYAARTYADLEAVIHDLPGPGVTAQLPAQAGGAAPDRIGGTPGPSFSVAIMSGAGRAGPWVLPPRYTAVAIMGGVELDLRQARFSEREASITVVAIMGGVSIIVPDDISLEVSGFGFMGGFDHPGYHSGDGPGPAGGFSGPHVKVTGFALMGGVEIKRRPAGRPQAPGTPELPGPGERGIEGRPGGF